MFANVSLARVILGYVCLVLVPLTGLLGLMRAGAGLRAPANVEGTWRMSLDAGACGLRFRAQGQPEARISQSGQFLSLRFNDLNNTTLGAELEQVSRDGFRAALPPDACKTFAPVPLEASRVR